MPDRVEEILKKIHVLLAKAEAYHGSTDRVIISKRDMFVILEELNEEVYHVLDRYEATSRSRDKARLEFEKYQADTIDRTKRKTEEVNAASLIYSDTMLNEVRQIIADAKTSFEEEMNKVTSQLEDMCFDIDVNKKDVLSKLRELDESERYEKLLEEERLNEGKKEKDKKSEAEESEDDAPKKAEIVVKIHDPGDTGITMFGKKRSPKKTKEEKKQMLEEMKRQEERHDEPSEEEPEVGEGRFKASDFDLDKEYFDFVDGVDGDSSDSSEKGQKKSVLDSFFNRTKISH